MGPLHDIWWGLQIINKVPAIKCTYCTPSHQKTAVVPVLRGSPQIPPPTASPITGKQMMVCARMFVACKHRPCQL